MSELEEICKNILMLGFTVMLFSLCIGIFALVVACLLGI